MYQQTGQKKLKQFGGTFFYGKKKQFTLEERVSMCKDYLEMGLNSINF